MLRPFLRLARIPNIFTAFSNVVAGVALARGGAFEPRDLSLVAASGALYTAGMVLNDYFDRHVDAIERPDRPIVAGEISAGAAAGLGAALVALGLACAAWHGLSRLAIAAALTAAIVLYDAWLKNTPFGPLAMGTCRALNVGLGLSVAEWQTPWLGALPLALCVFTLLITQLSRFEVYGTEAARLGRTVFALFALGIGIGPLLLGLAFGAHAGPAGAWALLPYAFALFRGRRLFSRILAEASPRTIGPAIGGGILLMPALDSAFVAARGAPIAAAVAFALAGPAYLLKRWYYLT